MKVKELAKILCAKTINESDFEREIACGYAGDLLSFVMGNAPTNCAWYTIMTNVNVCAVATLVDASVVVVCDDCEIDKMLIQKAQSQKINLLQTNLSVYDAIAKVSKHS